MTDYLKRAAEYLDVPPGSLINPRPEGDEYVVIVDEGIAGCKKYRIPLSELEPVATVIDDLGVYDMDYRDLQALAKELDIPANQSRDDLIGALWPEGYEEEE